MTKFRMGSLNHVHVVVPDRAAAAAWYEEHLGFEPVPEYAAWTRVEGGPCLAVFLKASLALQVD
jgi:catechol 2,3-dioxygenase-like lactoylglutathione lyase family enzyme